MREPGETVSEEKKYATQEKYEQNEGAIEASFLDGTGNQRGIVDLWQFLLVVGHVGGWLSLSSAILLPECPMKKHLRAMVASAAEVRDYGGHSNCAFKRQGGSRQACFR